MCVWLAKCISSMELNVIINRIYPKYIRVYFSESSSIQIKVNKNANF